MSRTKTMWPVLAVLLLAACGNNEGGNETASSDVNAPDDVTSSGASSVTFQGVTYEMEWVNCRASGEHWQENRGLRWQADAPLLSIDFSRNMDPGRNEYRYVLNAYLSDESGDPPPRTVFHNLYGWEFDPKVEASEAGIQGSGVVYPRDAPANEREALLMPVEFNIRC
jgi:hypothetical protein